MKAREFLTTKAYNIKHAYGISLEEYNQLLFEQGGVCAICKQPETRERKGVVQALSVDHNHKTGEVRGLLCNDCNRGIGLLKDNPVILQAAVDYLH